ncbi:MAG: deoxyribonuclease IV [Nitrospirae bacterium CG18_big_fil_WC_8_21_14_2_50_70_55]|nr:deoxyribonuclease IV [Deltaproteobacteria bacterium]OIP63976.1 MAG: deoxyribonuclease IV [Nitrospirae bacterium CG2_30_70_394]PIQ06693.1 MAG: deoxyribonuclease IV [Nitrospirae bacterium CG18_big_fil_WC_8_21_14_2_50_70_55]PIU77732.1 MAG: deoxyribonuclease IV [Nitrospirae bacterium CG06_land_8_20_14_3_00_70_43]PIW82571.1 MAG: deoxyribonuclease IV [Nitrospirae bacterium CG_4_8_14_3_um_filter_70_85]PIX83616.1 MAG: deoxyribonuclease IV [Nitrospirae bacterium CG_4_10_14_3_um_filter_70_108]PJB959
MNGSEPQITVGCHVSTSGGVELAPGRGHAIGCDAMQLFTRNQRSWRTRPLAEEEIAAFREARAASRLRTVMSHDSYLINLASPVAEMRGKSIAAFEDELVRCHQLGIELLNFHPGSHLASGVAQGIATLVESLDLICAHHPETTGVTLVLETVAGQGTNLGRTFEEIAAILDGVREPARFAVCVDTCHCFAAGYDLVSDAGWEASWDAFDRILGLQRLAAFHVNDSKGAFDSRKDRHARLGRGAMGAAPFLRLVTDPRTRHVPMFLETPTDPAGYAAEIVWLRTMAATGAIPPLPPAEEVKGQL